ncbi:hypothetical protein L9F63_019965, partial [Diploptera punctata]
YKAVTGVLLELNSVCNIHSGYNHTLLTISSKGLASLPSRASGHTGPDRNKWKNVETHSQGNKGEVLNER